MPRWLMFLIFLSFSVLVLGGVHFYFYRRLVVGPAWPGPWKTVLTIALVVLVANFPISFFVTRALEGLSARLILYPIYIWLGVMLMLFFLLLSIDLVRGIGWLVSRWADAQNILTDPQRRVFLSRTIAATATGTVALASGVALWRGLRQPTVKKVQVVLDKLPPSLDGFTIAQLTDIHLGAMRGGPWFSRVIQQTNQLKADLIAITGDLADARPDQLDREVDDLGKLRAPHGVFFVTGNHEYYGDLPAWLETLDRLKIRVLLNQRVTVQKNGEALELAGVTDPDGARLASEHVPDLPGALQGRDPQRPTVLLAHRPSAVEEASQHQVDLMLSGHTHGGQIWPWNYLVYLQQPYVSGLHLHRGTQVYVSEGTGFWGPPMRLGSTSEITLVTLRSGAKGKARG